MMSPDGCSGAQGMTTGSSKAAHDMANGSGSGQCVAASSSADPSGGLLAGAANVAPAPLLTVSGASADTNAVLPSLAPCPASQRAQPDAPSGGPSASKPSSGTRTSDGGQDRRRDWAGPAADQCST
jgi:hypothetical protein